MQSTKCALFFVCLFFTALLTAQTGQVSGTITDNDGNGGLPGATIYLKGSPGLGAVTDFDGTFTLGNIPVGEQTLVVTYVGFQDKEQTVVVVEGQITQMDVVLGAGVNLETVTISAQALGQLGAINRQLSSDGVANFVSADKIKELPDVNAAEAISRLPGVAINRSGGEGSKIVVRGLDPKFTAININGTRLPSTSGNDRSVDLSLISPELLSGIELFKSPTPDMDGDALGGTVNLNIIKADDRPRASVKVRGGYNDLTGQAQDYTATLSGSRRIFADKLGVIATANIERFNRSSTVVGQGWDDSPVVLDTANNIFDQQAGGISLGYNQEIRRRYNGSLGFDYTFNKATDVTLLGIFSRTTRDRFNHSESFSTPVNNSIRATPSIIESGTTLYSGSLTTRHKLNFANIEWGVNHSKTMGETPVNLSFRFDADFGGTTANWLPGFPDNLDNPNDILNFSDASIVRSALNRSGRSESSNSEEITTAFVDVTVPFNVGDRLTADFKFGGKLRTNYKERSARLFDDRLYYLRPIGVWSDLFPEPIGTAAADPSSYLSGENFVDPNTAFEVENNRDQLVPLSFIFDESILRRFDETFRDNYDFNRNNITDNYDLTENMAAFYGMFKFKLGDMLTVIPGARVEMNDNTYNGIFADLSGDWGQDGEVRDTTAEVQYTYFLPHLHLKYKPLDWFDVRVSYSTTLARPDFNYLVPAVYTNRNREVNIRAGNPTLVPSVSTNYDLVLTAFDSKFGLVSVGGFYKQIKDAFYPITYTIDNDSIAIASNLDPSTGINGAQFTSYGSSPDSEVYGIEFDLQSPLSFLPGVLSNLVFNLNYTRLFSSTTINNITQRSECRRVGRRIVCNNITTPIQREVALVGQASDIFNASLGYDIGGLSARVSASYQGSKITGYSNIADKDRFNREFWRMDASVKYRFNRRANVFLNLNNMTNQQDVSFFREERFETSRATYGMTAQVGFEYKFIPKESK